MLVLSRRVGEIVRIGTDILIHVLEIRGKQIRLGFEAPKEISIFREEVFRRIQSEMDEEFKESSEHNENE